MNEQKKGWANLDKYERIWVITCLVAGVIMVAVVLSAGILIGGVIGPLFCIVLGGIVSFYTFLPAWWLLFRKVGEIKAYD
jgi:hypothetical protein